MEKTFEALHLLLSQYKALSILCIAVVLMFPVITTAVMFAERTGFFGNVYQAEHAMLRGLAMEQHEIARGGLLSHDLLRGELIRNRGLIQGAAYFQQIADECRNMPRLRRLFRPSQRTSAGRQSGWG